MEPHAEIGQDRDLVDCSPLWCTKRHSSQCRSRSRSDEQGQSVIEQRRLKLLRPLQLGIDFGLVHSSFIPLCGLRNPRNKNGAARASSRG